MSASMLRVREFAKGFGFLVRGFTFLAGHPSLWFWAIIPTIINLMLLAAMITLFINYYSDIYSWLIAHLSQMRIEEPATWYYHVLNAVFWVLNILLQALIVLVSLILLLIVSYGASFIVASPFNDVLSERVEVIATETPSPPFSFTKFLSDLLRLIKIESVKALIFLAIPVVLFLFNFIPIVGGWVYVILTFIFGAWALGFAYADLPFGRRVAPLGERLQFARRNRWALIGLGIGFVVPFFSLIFAAPLVVGGTLLYVDATKK